MAFRISPLSIFKDKGVPVEDISVLLMADYGLELYGNAIIVNSKFAAEHPEAVKAFNAGVHERPEGDREATFDGDQSVLQHNGTAQKDAELERLTMTIRENIITPEVKANGYGEIDEALSRAPSTRSQLPTNSKARNRRPKIFSISRSCLLPQAGNTISAANGPGRALMRSRILT